MWISRRTGHRRLSRLRRPSERALDLVEHGLALDGEFPLETTDGMVSKAAEALGLALATVPPGQPAKAPASDAAAAEPSCDQGDACGPDTDLLLSNPGPCGP